ncbi:MAG: hypothetical protein NZL92_11460 [Gloeomargarita sp. SKYG116]|nr:hypothetical protein [Gloeomargarita sp. SKYG116]MDW8402299.1 hypothetical protein [Gloeomargarita sp. SKYGB_i_bin116]
MTWMTCLFRPTQLTTTPGMQVEYVGTGPHLKRVCDAAHQGQGLFVKSVDGEVAVAGHPPRPHQ